MERKTEQQEESLWLSTHPALKTLVGIMAKQAAEEWLASHGVANDNEPIDKMETE